MPMGINFNLTGMINFNLTGMTSNGTLAEQKYSLYLKKKSPTFTLRELKILPVP